MAQRSFPTRPAAVWAGTPHAGACGRPLLLDTYVKTALSDLQGAWIILRDAVVDNFGFPDSDKLLFHIDEAMSWESVHNLKRRKQRCF
jgi:hypothetical protein